MKKIIASVLVFAVCLSVCACAPDEPAPEPPPNVKTSPSVAELKAVRQQFWDVDRLSLEEYETGILATEAMPFAVDLDGDDTDEIGVLYDSYGHSSSALFYKSEKNKWVPFFTLRELPDYFSPFELEVYKKESGVILHATYVCSVVNSDNEVTYIETYADFSTNEPTVYFPQRTESKYGVTYHNTNPADNSKEITKEEFEALQAEILAGAELKETLSFPTNFIDGIATNK